MKPRAIQESQDGLAPEKQIIKNGYRIPQVQKSPAQFRADITGTPGDQNMWFLSHPLSPLRAHRFQKISSFSFIIGFQHNSGQASANGKQPGK
jgi:hypothetical protein